MTLVGILTMVGLVILGTPIYLAILACVAIILVVGVGMDPILPTGLMFSRLSDPILLAVPLFVLLGQVLAAGGAGAPLIRLVNAFMGHIPGGPAYALIFTSIIMAAMCAEPMAAIAAFGPLIIPTLVGLGYSEVFAVGLLLSSASLAPLIPPNIIAIFYVFMANPSLPPGTEPVNITTLWTASIIPGIVLAFLLCITVFFYSRRGHFTQLPAATWADRWNALKEAWPVAITPAAIMVPLYAKWATPTEVAAIGVVYVMLISRFFYGGLTWRTLWRSYVSTLHVLGAIFLIVMAAVLLNISITYAQLPQDITSWIADMGLNWFTFMIMIVLLYTIMGMFLDPTAIILISVPMLISTVSDLGINLYVFGVFTVVAVNLAGITPPYGLTIFASQIILGKPYHFVVKSCLMFLPPMVLGLILLGFVEPLSTWLPDWTGW